VPRCQTIITMVLGSPEPPPARVTVTGAIATRLTSHPGVWLTRATSHQAYRCQGA
jgi:hypothetical protein